MQFLQLAIIFNLSGFHCSPASRFRSPFSIFSRPKKFLGASSTTKTTSGSIPTPVVTPELVKPETNALGRLAQASGLISGGGLVVSGAGTLISSITNLIATKKTLSMQEQQNQAVSTITNFVFFLLSRILLNLLLRFLKYQTQTKFQLVSLFSSKFYRFIMDLILVIYTFRYIILLGSLIAIIGAIVKIILICRQRRIRQTAIAEYNSTSQV